MHNCYGVPIKKSYTQLRYVVCHVTRDILFIYLFHFLKTTMGQLASYMFHHSIGIRQYAGDVGYNWQ